MNATITTPPRNGLIFAEVPPAVESAVLDLLAANAQKRRAIRLGIGPTQTYAEMQHYCDAAFTARRHAETVIEEHQGGQRLNGLYPIEGKLVGFGKRSKRGFGLVIEPASSTLNQRKGGQR